MSVPRSNCKRLRRLEGLLARRAKTFLLDAGDKRLDRSSLLVGPEDGFNPLAFAPAGVNWQSIRSNSCDPSRSCVDSRRWAASSTSATITWLATGTSRASRRISPGCIGLRSSDARCLENPSSRFAKAMLLFSVLPVMFRFQQQLVAGDFAPDGDGIRAHLGRDGEVPHFAGRRFDAGRADVDLVGVAEAADADLTVRVDLDAVGEVLGESSGSWFRRSRLSRRGRSRSPRSFRPAKRRRGRSLGRRPAPEVRARGTDRRFARPGRARAAVRQACGWCSDGSCVGQSNFVGGAGFFAHVARNRIARKSGTHLFDELRGRSPRPPRSGPRPPRDPTDAGSRASPGSRSAARKVRPRYRAGR